MSQRIRQRMEELGYSGDQLERECGLSKGYVSKLLSGHRGKGIRPENLSAIATALQTTPTWLRLGRDPEPGEILTAGARMSPELDRLPGYREAEIEVARAEPKLPVKVFEFARQWRIQPVPQRVTTPLLRGIVRQIAEMIEGQRDVGKK